MSQVAINADAYAATRQNIFFTGVTPDLDGQCVSLVKWFMQDMSEVPNPQMARGDAKNVGKTLVRQGHAIEVPFSERRRGDIICYEYGTYGHIAVQLSNGLVFEQNVNMGGVSRKWVDGAWVYASRIGSEAEGWRVGKNPHIYRLLSYSEGGNTMSEKQAYDMALAIGLALMFSMEEINSPWHYNLAARTQLIKADPYNYPTALLLDKEVGYNSPHWQNLAYKASHYDADVQAAYEKGKAEGGSAPADEYEPAPMLYTKKVNKDK